MQQTLRRVVDSGGARSGGAAAGAAQSAAVLTRSLLEDFGERMCYFCARMATREGVVKELNIRAAASARQSVGVQADLSTDRYLAGLRSCKDDISAAREALKGARAEWQSSAASTRRLLNAAQRLYSSVQRDEGRSAPHTPPVGHRGLAIHMPDCGNSVASSNEVDHLSKKLRALLGEEQSDDSTEVESWDADDTNLAALTELITTVERRLADLLPQQHTGLQKWFTMKRDRTKGGNPSSLAASLWRRAKTKLSPRNKPAWSGLSGLRGAASGSEAMVSSLSPPGRPERSVRSVVSEAITASSPQCSSFPASPELKTRASPELKARKSPAEPGSPLLPSGEGKVRRTSKVRVRQDSIHGVSQHSVRV